MNDKHGKQVAVGDTIEVDPYELKRSDGTVYHVIPREVCKVGLQKDGKTICAIRSNGCWFPALDERDTFRIQKL